MAFKEKNILATFYKKKSSPRFFRDQKMSYIKEEFDKICITNLKLVGLTE